MAVLCGNCKSYHDNAGDVKACYLGTGFGPVTATAKAATDAAKMGAPATEKQLRFLEDLRRAKLLDGQAEDVRMFNPGTKAEASRLIGILVALPDKPKAPGKPAATELEDGIYLKDDTYFKVYHTLNNGHQVAKRLVLIEPDCGGCTNGELCDPPCKWGKEWIYEGRKPLHSLFATMKLDEAAAKEFGMVYGFCVFGHELNREESLYVGYGKTCAAKNGWWYPTKAELRALVAAGATQKASA